MMGLKFTVKIEEEKC